MDVSRAGVKSSQHAYENYTVTRQTSDSLVWKDLYGDYRTFVKIQ